MLRPKKPTTKKPITPEAIIQKQTESYLRLKRIPYLRIPDGVYKSIKRMGRKDAGQTAHALAGWPDIMIYRVDPNGNLLALAIELKSARGVLSPDQKKWQEHLRTKVARSFDEAKILIDEFWNRSL